MKEAPFSLDFDNEEESFALKDILFKYLRYWPWFLAAVVLTVGLGYLYLRYAPVIYQTVAKIKISFFILSPNHLYLMNIKRDITSMSSYYESNCYHY